MIRDIPPSRLATCELCADRIDINDAGVYQFASGWTKNGNKGNSLTLTKHYRRYACRECIDRMRSNINLAQSTIFDAMGDGRDDESQWGAPI